MRTRFTLGIVTYFWKCSKCGTAYEEFHRFHWGQEIRHPSLPAGWVDLKERFYCPSHKIVILVDSEPVVTFVGGKVTT